MELPCLNFKWNMIPEKLPQRCGGFLVWDIKSDDEIL